VVDGVHVVAQRRVLLRGQAEGRLGQIPSDSTHTALVLLSPQVVLEEIVTNASIGLALRIRADHARDARARLIQQLSEQEGTEEPRRSGQQYVLGRDSGWGRKPLLSRLHERPHLGLEIQLVEVARRCSVCVEQEAP
jgi:hypothetical protein